MGVCADPAYTIGSRQEQLKLVPLLKMKTSNIGVWLITGIALLAGDPSLWAGSNQTAQSSVTAPPVVTAAEPPASAETLQVEWINVAGPGKSLLLTAVARPKGKGPFPTVIILHGSHGFALEYVHLAQALADAGILAVAACWFSGGGGAGARFVTSIDCPDAPPRPESSSPVALQTLDALVAAVRTLPGANPERIGLFGHSRGGGAALNYLISSGNVQAAVLNSAGYPSSLSDVVSRVNTPILILHGTADSPEEGGSAFTDVQMARNFEATLRRLGKSVEAHYYEGSGHNTIFTSSTQFKDEAKRMATFFLRYLSN